MRRFLVVTGLLVLAACSSPTAPKPAAQLGPCGVHIRLGPGAGGLVLSLGYPHCPTKAWLDATYGPNGYWVTWGH